MRAVACVSSWCNQLIIDRSLDSAFTFLWDFSWKVIKSPTYDSEACSSAYETFIQLQYMRIVLISSPSLR